VTDGQTDRLTNRMTISILRAIKTVIAIVMKLSDRQEIALESYY